MALPLVDFYKHPLALWLPAYIVLAIIVVVGTSNGVNITDGLDGLAIGPVIISAATFLILAYGAGTVIKGFNVAEYLKIPYIHGSGELAIFCGAIVGAGIGFLWFNTYPGGGVHGRRRLARRSAARSACSRSHQERVHAGHRRRHLRDGDA